jgi:hypothetical protein
MTPARKLTRREWLRLPYAKSAAKDADGAIVALLLKYKTEYRALESGSIDGRPVFQVRFTLRGKAYRVRLLGLLTAGVSEEELLLQAKRAVYHHLKTALEQAEVFFSPEETLFAFRELPTQQTIFEAASPHLEQLTAPDVGRLLGCKNDNGETRP